MNDKVSIAVLGGTGYVGRALLRLLERRDLQKLNVHGLVRGSADRLQSKNVKVFCGDLFDIPEGFFPKGPYVVVHLGTKQIDRDKTGFWKNNVEGTKNVLAGLTDGCVGMVYGSSLSVHGQGEQLGIDETIGPEPGTALARSRVEAERLIELEAAKKHFTAFSLRPRFILGDGDKYTLPGLIRLFKKGLSFRKCTAQYSIIDVDDYAEVIVRLIESIDEKRVKQQAIHVGYRKPLSFSTLEQVIVEEMKIPRPRIRLPVTPSVLSLGRMIPAKRAESLTTKLELLGQSHFGNVRRLEELIGTSITSKNPENVLSDAIKKGLKRPQPC